MTKTATDAFGYSTEVDMWMECGVFGNVPLRQTAPTFVIPAEPRELPACNAVIVLVVDGKTFKRPVTLVRGMSPTKRKVMVLSRDDISPF